MLELNFGNTPEKIKGKCLDMYKGIQSQIINTTRSHENSDLSKTYLSRLDITRGSKIKAEEKFPIPGKGYTIGKLLNGAECQILLDTGM